MKNHLKIVCPEITPSMGEVTLNGKPLRDIVSLKIELSGKRDDPFVKVTAEFYSSFELEGVFSQIKTDGHKVAITA
ncbi:MAG: hypothetical protein ACRD8A_07135 [Candidatus Acidiferrales bacterium]